MASVLICNKCGKCCKTGLDNHDCPYLLRLGDKTHCMIYKTRLGTEIAPGFHCGERSETKHDFKDCPYNTGKELFKE